MTKNSFCWWFFDKKTYQKADENNKRNNINCEKCGKAISYTMGCSTGSLRHHLAQDHNLCETNFKRDKMYQTRSKTANTNNENTNNDHENNASANSDSYLIDCLIDFLLSTDQSFSLVENDEFIKLVRALNKKFKIPVRNTLINTHIPNKVLKNLNSSLKTEI